MKEIKLTTIARILIFYLLLNVLCFPLLGEDAKQSETNMNTEIKQKEEAAKILSGLGEKTGKYPKIIINLCGVPFDDVGKCIKAIKDDKLGDGMAFYGIEDAGWKYSAQMREKQHSFILNWIKQCQNANLCFFLPVNILSKEETECIYKRFGNNVLGTLSGGEDASWNGALDSLSRRFKSKDNMKEVRDSFVNNLVINAETNSDGRFLWSGGVETLKRNEGTKCLLTTEIGPVGHGETLEAGVDICSSEHVNNICTSMSSARGASGAYGRPVWAAFLNVEFYGGSGWYGPPKDDSYTPRHQRRMMLDYELSYVYGTDLIILQDCLFGMRIANFFDKKWPIYNDDSPECQGFRKIAKSFYAWAKSHPRSDQRPAVDLGMIWGNYEGTPLGALASYNIPHWNQIEVFKPNWEPGCEEGYKLQVWGQDGDEWKPTIECGWRNLYDILIPGQSHRKDTCRYAGTPYGQVDIVPIRAPIDVLKKYKTLMFLGWNTMTPEIYGKLKEYVKNGGTLFMSLPQLSQQVERKPELEIINNGDFRDLFGITVNGKLERKFGENTANIVKFDRDSSLKQFTFPVGNTFVYTNDYPDLEWADVKVEGAQVIASAGDAKIPVLIDNKLGKGVAYLMTTYSFSPAPAEFVKPLVVGTVKAGEFELLGELDEKRDINYAVYPGKTAEAETKILLVNIDWATANNVKNVKMRIKDMVMPMEVKEGTIKTVNVLGDLVLSVCDESQCLSLDKFVDGKTGKYTGKVTGQGVCVIKGTMRGDKGPQKVTLDGKDIYFKYDPTTHMFTAECNLWGEHVLEMQK